VRIRLEKKGRGGKVVTVLYDLPTGPEDGLALAKRIKALCGSGGTFKDGRIEVQGEHRPRLQGFLEGLGYRVRLSGG
jgi:translation initiation factor 1